MSTTPLCLRKAGEVNAALDTAVQRSESAQRAGDNRLYWQHQAVVAALEDPFLPRHYGLAHALALLWRCGVLDRLPETEQEQLALGLRLRDAMHEGERRAQ